MHDMIKTAVEALEKEITRTKNLDGFLQIAMEAVPHGEFSLVDGNAWCRIYPQDKDSMIEDLRSLAKAGIKQRKNTEPYMNGQCLAYNLYNSEHQHVSLFVSMSKSKTCSVVQVGIEKKPILEVQCL